MLKRAIMFLKATTLMIGLGMISSEAFCGGTIDGSVVSDLPKNKEGVVVYLKGVIGGTAAPRTTVVEQHHLVFIPHVTTIPVGSTVVFTNHDKIHHNVFSQSEAKKFNFDFYDTKKTKRVTFDKPGVINLLCNVHPEMSAWIVVTENRFAAVTGKEGDFVISDVPAGTYEMVAWSEHLKPQGVKTVTVENGRTVKVAVKLGD
ncbi:MAG: hypothetical protein HGB29_08395 [Chlorobiaceae bacterium]|nr:hypothetical protein [Chlorobiaceae bacterium]NTW74869.1 hypothetical protein [Chlorobiaceae bacterium]